MKRMVLTAIVIAASSATFSIAELALNTTTVESAQNEKVTEVNTQQTLGDIRFQVSCNTGKTQEAFDRAMALLHSFEYDQARLSFESITQADAQCAMGHWGSAMSYLRPLWFPPTEDELNKARKAAAMAAKIGGKNPRERAFISAINSYYFPLENYQHQERMAVYEKSMAQMYASYPKDVEVATFYALIHMSNMGPDENPLTRRLRAGEIMQPFTRTALNHPGLTHYIIHAYDHPELAHMALGAAKHYAVIAPDSTHALHMPSHIFERLGMWQDSIVMNIRAADAARRYAKKANITGHWDEELHALVFLADAYMQTGEYNKAQDVYDYVGTMKAFYPINGKTAGSIAGVQARVMLDKQNWHDAAQISHTPDFFPWNDFPTEAAIINFTAGYGNIRLGKIEETEVQIDVLKQRQKNLQQRRLPIQEKRVISYIKILSGWVLYQQGEHKKAIDLLKDAVDVQMSFGVQWVALPAAESLADLYLEMGRPNEALKAYKELNVSKRRRSAINTALSAAKAMKDKSLVKEYKALLIDIAEATSNIETSLTLSDVTHPANTFQDLETTYATQSSSTKILAHQSAINSLRRKSCH